MKFFTVDMSVKIKKATANSLHSFETYTKSISELWFTEMRKNMKDQAKTYREKIIKSCITHFCNEFSIDEGFVEELHKSTQEVCSKHKFGKIKVNCPDFIINHEHSEEDLANSKKGQDMEDFKKYIFEIKKKKDPTERKPRQAVSVYHLYQSKKRALMKKKGMTSDEIREELKVSWKDFKENDVEFKKLKEIAMGMDELPNKKQVNGKGLGRTAYHLFQKSEKALYRENNPGAEKDEVNKHVSDTWKEVKENDKQYNEYIKMAEEMKAEEAEANVEEVIEYEEKPKKKKKKKEKKEKKEKKAKVIEEEEEEVNYEDDVIEHADEVKIVDENEEINSEAEIGDMVIEHSEDDSDIGK